MAKLWKLPALFGCESEFQYRFLFGDGGLLTTG
jgi:hypothetical protein